MIDQHTELCPLCKGPLTRVRRAFLCLSLEHDCDYSAPRHTPLRITEPEAPEPYERKHAIPRSAVEQVFDFITENPWATVAEVAGGLVVDRGIVRTALKRREEFGIVRVRTTPRSPYRYAHKSVTTTPDVEYDRRITALPWKPVRRWEQDEERFCP